MTEAERIITFTNMMEEHLGVFDTSILRNKLIELDYFKVPASIHHHSNYEGGLFDHSYAVTRALVKLTGELRLKWQRSSSPYVVGMLHDLCKCVSYIYNEETGQWEYNNCGIMTGHGDLSVIMAQKLIDLTEEEMLCIRWHMGAYDESKNWNILGNAIEKYPNVLYTHTADMIASRVNGI